MTKPRYAADSDPDVILAVEVPRSLRDEMRRWADQHGQTLESWAFEALRQMVEVERDLAAWDQRKVPRPAAKLRAE